MAVPIASHTPAFSKMISKGSSGTSGKLSFTKFEIPTNTAGVPLISTAKRYTRRSGLLPETGWILFCAHGTGFNKELWEPTIEEMFLQDEAQGLHIREAWAVDCQSHGEAAIVNEKAVLKAEEEDPSFIPIYEYGDAFSQLAKSDVLGFDSSRHKLGIVGHSAGAVGAILATTFFSPPTTIPFSMLILVEPGMKPPNSPSTDAYEAIMAMTPSKRDTWDSRDSARTWLTKRIPWAMWDSRVMDLFIEYGLRPLPTLTYPSKTGVTLTSTRVSEARAFGGTRQSIDALYRLAQVAQYPNIEIHLVFGDRGDFYSRENQESIIAPSEGRTFKSVSWIEDAGHLILQESPEKLATAVYGILARFRREIKDKDRSSLSKL